MTNGLLWNMGHVQINIDRMISPSINNYFPQLSPCLLIKSKPVLFLKTPIYCMDSLAFLDVLNGPSKTTKAKQFLLFSWITQQEFRVRHGEFVLATADFHRWVWTHPDGHESESWHPDERSKKTDEAHPYARSKNRIPNFHLFLLYKQCFKLI